MLMITVGDTMAREWARFAQAAYATGRNDVGHRFSGINGSDQMPINRYDAMGNEYRAWLVFNEWPKV